MTRKELEKQNENLQEMLKAERELKINEDYLKKICELEDKIEKLKSYIIACWNEESINNYSNYVTNSKEKYRNVITGILYD